MVSDLLAGAAILISVCALVMEARGRREANRLQARIVVLEEARQRDAEKRALRAELTVARQTSAAPTRSSQLVIRNDGQAAARDIALFFDGHPCREHPCGAMMREMPEVIGPGCEAKLLLCETLGVASPRVVRLSWRDESNATRTMETAFT